MPKTLRKAVPRMNVRIPRPMIDKIETILTDHPGLYNNRQQFIESAIREEIKRITLMESTTSKEIDPDPPVDIKDIFLAHVLMHTIQGKNLPADHLDPKQLEQSIRRYVMKIAEQEGKKITEKRLDELTKNLLEYHKKIVEGLTLSEHLEH